MVWFYELILLNCMIAGASSGECGGGDGGVFEEISSGNYCAIFGLNHGFFLNL